MKCEEASPEEVNSIIESLEKELKLSGERGFEGIGLAAPQIGIYKKVAIIRLKGISVNLVNPVIEDKFDPTTIEGEGCLSFPGLKAKTRRFNEIHVKNDVYPENFIATEMLAVVIQHEKDHLDGILLPDVSLKEEVSVHKKVRPNDLCPCGSGKKNKKCCRK